MNKLIVTENLTKEYILEYKLKQGSIAEVEKNSVLALNNVNFTIYEGEFLAIMGPSGAGKSTFVNMISTIDTPTKGKVFIDGKKLSTLREGEISKLRFETIGFVFQDFNLLDNLTIAENIAIPLKLAGVKKFEEPVLEIAKKLNIENLLKKYPNECSGGQIQRCSIARALINNPKIIIADEPTGNLDSENSKNILKILKDLNENFGITILIVTHDPLTASYSKKTINIKDGEINNTFERGTLTQRQYFDEILKLVSGDIDI